MTIKINLCQGLRSQHIVMVGDASAGKSYRTNELLQGLPLNYKKWAWDDTHTAFDGVGAKVRSINGLLDASVQYLPQEFTKEEMIEFLKLAHRLGKRVVALDEFHKYQNSKSIHPDIAYFLKTFKQRGGSWIAIAQSPLEFNDVVYHNMHHLFAFYVKTANRHIDKYYEWFSKPLTRKLIDLFFEVDGTKLKRPFIYQGASAREPILYSHKGRFVIRENGNGDQVIVALPRETART